MITARVAITELGIDFHVSGETWDELREAAEKEVIELCDGYYCPDEEGDTLVNYEIQPNMRQRGGKIQASPEMVYMPYDEKRIAELKREYDAAQL